jgi:outer membrane protein TolC
MQSTPSTFNLRIRMILRISFLIAGIGFTGALNAQKSMSLEDCIAYALERHPQIKLAQLEIRDADWQIKENTAVALPQLNIGVNYQYFLQQPELPAEALGFSADPGTKFTFALRNNLTGTISVNQLLFNNSYLLGIKAAKEYRKYVDIKLEAAKTALRNSVTDAYVPALILSENIDILNKNLEVQQQLLHETREVYKAGFAEQLDVDRIEYASTTLETERDNLIRQREILVDLLQFAIHMPVREEIVLTDDVSRLLMQFADINPDESLAYENRPEYVAVLKARELSEIQVDLYAKNWLPSLSAFVQYQPSYQGNNKLFWIPSALAGIQLNIPLYDGGLARAKKERAMVTASEVILQKETLEQAYDLELETARKQIANARARVASEERNLSLAQRIYDTSQTKFQSGVGSSLEVTQALSGLYQSQGLLIQARYELLKARISVKRALGNT